MLLVSVVASSISVLLATSRQARTHFLALQFWAVHFCLGLFLNLTLAFQPPSG